jgi:hypothetical protein
LEKLDEKYIGAKVAIDCMKYKNGMREMGVLQSAIPVSLFQKVLSLSFLSISKWVGKVRRLGWRRVAFHSNEWNEDLGKKAVIAFQHRHITQPQRRGQMQDYALLW